MAQLVAVGKLGWTASTSPDVQGYNVYYGNATDVAYTDPFVYVAGASTEEIQLPVAGQPTNDGLIWYGVAPVDDVGNIGDLAKVSITLDNIAPVAVTNLHYVAP